MSLLEGLITSKTRIRILMRLFLNPGQKTYLRELATEFGLSSGHVSDELRHLNDAGLLSRDREGRQVNYHANIKHPLFPELHSMVKKALGMDQILESIIDRLGDVEHAFLLDDYAQGKDTGIIDLALVGDINQANLIDLVAKTERYIGRKVRALVLSKQEYNRLQPMLKTRPQLMLWSQQESDMEKTNGPHVQVCK